MSTLAFGKKFTDHMAHMRWTREGGWSDRGVIPYGPLELTPGASVFRLLPVRLRGHQGLQASGRLRVDLPPRLQRRASEPLGARLALPELSREDFVASLVDYVRAT